MLVSYFQSLIIITLRHQEEHTVGMSPVKEWDKTAGC